MNVKADPKPQWRDELLCVVRATDSVGQKIVLIPAYTMKTLTELGWTPPADVLVFHPDRIVKPDGSVISFESWPSASKSKTLSQDEWGTMVLNHIHLAISSG